MTTMRRLVELFTAGCPICADAVALVETVMCPDCELRLYDVREGCATNECREKVRRYGITAVPAVAVDGMLLDYCRVEPITADRLRAAGIGQP
jgi:hypothetical protein